jgi:NAD(P)-dependent dehydrogenase (short-subunit alcohol dehydrogenase family)
MRLTGRVAVVTGGAKGIGLGISNLFGSEGAHVVLAGRDEAAIRTAERDLVKQGIRAVGYVGDVSSASDVRRILDGAMGQFGRVDILINNAGVNPGFGRSLVDLGETDWDTTMAVNLRGLFLCTKGVVPLMKQQGRGWIVNICSLAGRLVSDGKNAAYKASKFGVRGFTWSAAKDLRDDNIAVSAILPGITRSPMVARATGDPSAWLDPSDVAEAALFLVTRDPKVVIPEITIAPRVTIGTAACPYS